MKKILIVAMLLMFTMISVSCKETVTEETTDVDTTAVVTPTVDSVETTTTTTVEVDTLQ